VLRRPRTPPVPTSLAYKRAPFFAEKIHTIHSYLLDILLSLLALPIELAVAGRAPRAPRVPGDSGAAPTYRRSRAAEKDSHHRRDTSPPPKTAAGEHPTAVSLLDSLSLLFPIGLGKTPDNDSVFKS
jgi:hypothetical protein